MKCVKFLLPLMLAMAVACGKESGDVASGNLPHYIFTITEDDITADKSVDEATVKKDVYGYGWKWKSTNEINRDGTVCGEDYYKDMDGGSPVSYYFGGGSLVSFFFSDAHCGQCCKHQGIAFKDSAIYVQGLFGVVSQFTLKVLELDGDTMTCIEYLGVRNDGKVYGLSVFRKMTEKELNSMKDSCDIFIDAD